MAYIIENIIEFDEIKGSIINLDTRDEITLPPSAACILLMLLQQGNSPVERDAFIEQVYVKFGYDMSNNTLNQYVSLLRKNIRNLGVENDVIITIPRVGFFISTDVVVLKETVPPPVNDDARKVSVSTKRNNKILFITISVVLLAFCFILFFISRAFTPENYELIKAGSIESCDLYLPVNLQNVNAPGAVMNASILSREHLPCTPGSIFIYDIDIINFATSHGRTFLARCTGLPKEKQYATCSEVSISEN